MNKPVQTRTLETRAKLIEAAKAVVLASGYEGLRVEEVVRRAGVAKGTFFAHFKDKDVLMDQLIGARLKDILDSISEGPQPRSALKMVQALRPLIEFTTSERYVYDVILRHSGAAGISEIGPIAKAFEQQFILSQKWIANPELNVRTDIPQDLLAEGVGAFLIQAISLAFCALHNSVTVEDRLVPYLEAWIRCCLLYTSPSPRDLSTSRMPSSA